MIPGATPRFGGPGGFPGGRIPVGPFPGGPVGRRPGGPGEGSPIVGDLPFTRGPLGGQLGLAVMKAELKLSEDQAAKIRSIQTEADKKVNWTPASPGPPPGPDVLGRVEQEMREAILKVLTAEQKEKLTRLLGSGPSGPRPPMPLP